MLMLPLKYSEDTHRINTDYSASNFVPHEIFRFVKAIVVYR